MMLCYVLRVANESMGLVIARASAEHNVLSMIPRSGSVIRIFTSEITQHKSRLTKLCSVLSVMFLRRNGQLQYFHTLLCLTVTVAKLLFFLFV